VKLLSVAVPDKIGYGLFMEIKIRNVTEHDLADIVRLLRDFAEYENLAEYCEVTEQRLHDAIFGENGFVEGLIALDDATPVAYALFYPNFSSFRGERGLYLEDIYITADYRRLNLGEKMLREIARIARSRGLTRIDFLVLDWNTPAVNFYLKHGAEHNEGENHFKFAGEAFDRLSETQSE
jgi:ribosomal protein S18 acetylase RimI-like enzyme